MSVCNSEADIPQKLETGRTTCRPTPYRRRWLPYSAIFVAGSLLAASAMAQGIDKAIDDFFASAFGWFVALIFHSVPVGGASISFGAVIDFSDAAIFAMSIFNLIGVYILMPVVKEEYNRFIAKVESGEFKRYF